MHIDINNVLSEAANGKSLPETAWLDVIDNCLKSFREFIGSDFARADECMVDVNHSTFSKWIWSLDTEPNELEMTWSAVIAGGRAGGDRFDISVTLLLFHKSSRQRIVSFNKGAYLLYSYVRDDNGDYAWKSHGWVPDESGEWDDIQQLE